MKNIAIIILSLIGTAPIYAQDLTIAQALSQAKNEAVLQSNLEYDIQNINLKIQRNKRLPLIYGEGNVQRNLIIPVTPVPAIAFDPSAPAGAIMPLRFATDWSAKGGLQLSLDVFNPQNKTNILSAEQQVRKAAIEQKASQQDFKKTITDLYAQAYLAQQQLDIAIQNEMQYQSTLAIIKSRYESGRASAIEWNNANKKMLELTQVVTEAQYVLRNKYIALSPYLDTKTFDNLTTPIDSLVGIETTNIEKERLLLDRDIKQGQLDLLKYDALPKLTLNGYLGSQFYSNEFKILKSDNWYGNSYVNLTLRLPITEVFERKLRRQQYQKELEVARSKVTDQANNESVSLQQKQNNIHVLEQKIKSLEQSKSLVMDNVNIIKAQVEEGRVLVTELNSALETQSQVQQQLWQAYYDLLQTKLND